MLTITRKISKYDPHQGRRERLRRIKQVLLGQIPSEQLQDGYATLQSIFEAAKE
jgi:hypothetical protein